MANSNANIVTSATPAIDLDAQPDASWSMDRLAQYAAAAFQQSSAHEAEADKFEKLMKTNRRTSVVAFFRGGQALRIAKQQQKENGTWGKWQEANGLSATTVLMAIAIYEGAKTEDMVSRFTLEQAKKAWVKNYGKKRPRPVNEPQASVPLSFCESLAIASSTLAALLEAPIEVAEVEKAQAQLLAIMTQVQTLQTRTAKVQLVAANRELAAKLEATEKLIAA